MPDSCSAHVYYTDHSSHTEAVILVDARDGQRKFDMMILRIEPSGKIIGKIAEKGEL